MNVQTALRAELHRYQLLSNAAKRLFVSSFLYEISSPIAFMFTNAFLFQHGESNALVALYNLGMYIGLPFGFYLNGYLLRHFRFATIFAIGVPLQGLAGLVLFFLTDLSPVSVFLFGGFFGVAMSVYWANRNYLTLMATTDDQRTYFGGLEQVMATYVGIVIPFVMGIGLASLPLILQLPELSIFRLFAFVALGIHLVTGVVIYGLDVENPHIIKIVLTRASRQWSKVRLLEIILGIENGLEIFVPSLIILTFLGGVATLGILSSASAIIGSVAVYAVSSRIRPSQRASRLFFFTLAKILLTALYALFFSRTAAMILIVLSPSLLQLKWPLQQGQVSKTLEDEEGGDITNNYAYVADEELFLNIGRVIGVGIFFAVGYVVSSTLTLRFLPLILTVSQLGVAYVVYNLSHHSYTLKKV